MQFLLLKETSTTSFGIESFSRAFLIWAEWTRITTTLVSHCSKSTYFPIRNRVNLSLQWILPSTAFFRFLTSSICRCSEKGQEVLISKRSSLVICYGMMSSSRQAWVVLGRLVLRCRFVYNLNVLQSTFRSFRILWCRIIRSIKWEFAPKLHACKLGLQTGVKGLRVSCRTRLWSFDHPQRLNVHFFFVQSEL